MDIEINFEKTCRTCAQCFTDDLHQIFVSKNFKIMQMLEGINGFNFKITKDDALPKVLCEKCAKQLTEIYLFFLQCEKSELILTEKLQEQIKIVNKKAVLNSCKIEISENFESSTADTDASFQNLLQDFERTANGENDVKSECSSISTNNGQDIQTNFTETEDLCEKDTPTICKDKTNKFEKKTHNLRRREKISSEIKNIKIKSPEEAYEKDKTLSNDNKLSKHRNYECSICSVAFSKFANLREHKKEKHPIQPVTFLCDICGRKFNKGDRLLQHKNRHLGFKPFKCNICEKSFSIKGSFRSHMQRHANPETYKCDICAKNFLIKKCYEEHLRRHENEEKLFKCPYCPRTFNLLSTLTHHCTFHNKTLDKKYHCEQCNTNFRRSDHLKEHINGVHLKILPFKCEICPQAFVTGAKRNIHVKRMHSGKRYQCNQCEKDFSLPSSLNRHKKGHSGVKSLICEICNESFVTPAQIKKHMETHELDEAAKKKLITQTYEKIKHIAVNQEELNDIKIF